MLQEKHEYKVILVSNQFMMLTILQTTIIESKYGKVRADLFQDNIKWKLQNLGYKDDIFPKTQILYQN